MALPSNNISVIRLPGDSVDREIIPVRLKNGQFLASLPTLSADATIAVTGDIPRPLTTTAKSSVERWPGGNYSSDVSHFVTPNDIYYWNGAVTGTTSYLAYCNQGAFGTAATHSASDFATSGHTHSQANLTSWLGFGALRLATDWGTITANNGYTIFFGSDQGNGGGVVFGEKGGRTSLQVDGDIYVNEGQTKLTGNTGTVTSIGTSGTGLSGGTITTTGTITLDSSSAGNAAINKVVLRSAAGTLQSEKYAVSSGITTKATMQYNTTDDCIEFVFA